MRLLYSASQSDKGFLLRSPYKPAALDGAHSQFDRKTLLCIEMQYCMIETVYTFFNLCKMTKNN
jgi:hypothetical protein